MSLPWAPALPIRTARLDLRVHRPDDLDDLLQFHSDPEVVRYLPWPVRGRAQVEEALAKKPAQGVVTQDGDWLVLAMQLRETGRVIGEILLKCTSDDRGEAELGFALHRGYHRLGLGTEAGRAMLALAFGELGMRRVTASLDARNAASAGLLERLGMRREGHFVSATRMKGEWVDDLAYAILASEFVDRADHPGPATGARA